MVSSVRSGNWMVTPKFSERKVRTPSIWQHIEKVDVANGDREKSGFEELDNMLLGVRIES